MAGEFPAGLPTLSRRSRILIAVGTGVLVLLIVGAALIDTYVAWRWFGALGYRDVYSTILLTRISVGAAGGAFVGGLLALNLVVAYRTRRFFLPLTGPEGPVDRYRAAIEPRARLVAIAVPIVVGLVTGLIAQRNWQTVQLYFNSTGFGIDDPEFGHDISFFGRRATHRNRQGAHRARRRHAPIQRR